MHHQPTAIHNVQQQRASSHIATCIVKCCIRTRGHSYNSKQCDSVRQCSSASVNASAALLCCSHSAPSPSYPQIALRGGVCLHHLDRCHTCYADDRCTIARQPSTQNAIARVPMPPGDFQTGALAVCALARGEINPPDADAIPRRTRTHSPVFTNALGAWSGWCCSVL